MDCPQKYIITKAKKIYYAPSNKPVDGKRPKTWIASIREASAKYRQKKGNPPKVTKITGDRGSFMQEIQPRVRKLMDSEGLKYRDAVSKASAEYRKKTKKSG